VADRESPFSCHDCHGANSCGSGLCLETRKIIGEASEFVDGENENWKTLERVHAAAAEEEEEENGRARGGERERERERVPSAADRMMN